MLHCNTIKNTNRHRDVVTHVLKIQTHCHGDISIRILNGVCLQQAMQYGSGIIILTYKTFKSDGG